MALAVAPLYPYKKKLTMYFQSYYIIMDVPFSEHLVLKYVLQNLTSASIYSRLRTLIDDIARVDVMEVSVCVPVMYRPCYLSRGCSLLCVPHTEPSYTIHHAHNCT